jgi:hypothetical protein
LKDKISDQQKCLKDFGESQTADLSLIDQNITTISLDEKKFVIKDLDEYFNSMSEARIPEE